jgi:formiminotetrahydrofolate cyclodeaminase
MQERLTQLSCDDFASKLAAKESVPGGGGAAALAGALGAALGSMVGNFTIGKKKYADVQDDIERMCASAEGIRIRLLDLVQKDAEAFEPLSRAYGIPKEDPMRAQVLEEATLAACQAPLEMMRAICEAIDLLEEMGRKGSRMLLSDVGCGAYLCAAALQAASLNIFVNTATLANRETAQRLDCEVDSMLASYVPLANDVAARVETAIRRD